MGLPFVSGEFTSLHMRLLHKSSLDKHISIPGLYWAVWWNSSYHYPSRNRRDKSEGRDTGPEDRYSIHEPWILICPAEFVKFLGTCDYVFPSVLSLWIRDFYHYQLLSYTSLTSVSWEQMTYFLLSQAQQMERDFAPWWIRPRASSMPNLDDLDDEIWDFGADKT